MLAVALYNLWQRSSSTQYARFVPSDDCTCQNCDRHIASALTAHRAHRLDDDVGGDIDELVFRPNPELL